uniref:Uncharacterized protein n=1 Tax=Micrurus spixii TaxID=129469 RepID=A0A2D4M2B0_9SAUR
MALNIQECHERSLGRQTKCKLKKGPWRKSCWVLSICGPKAFLAGTPTQRAVSQGRCRRSTDGLAQRVTVERRKELPIKVGGRKRFVFVEALASERYKFRKN